ncbi:hypothetical protein AMJ85_09175 [candidate division BRC1 bacterium SM23_51]|nr:MAG: hypothetical protein AMJ85_09175 [candidate division BRC1 bacterium SM23_51]
MELNECEPKEYRRRRRRQSVLNIIPFFAVKPKPDIFKMRFSDLKQPEQPGAWRELGMNVTQSVWPAGSCGCTYP